VTAIVDSVVPLFRGDLSRVLRRPRGLSGRGGHLRARRLRVQLRDPGVRVPRGASAFSRYTGCCGSACSMVRRATPGAAWMVGPSRRSWVVAYAVTTSGVGPDPLRRPRAEEPSAADRPASRDLAPRLVPAGWPGPPPACPQHFPQLRLADPTPRHRRAHVECPTAGRHPNGFRSGWSGRRKWGRIPIVRCPLGPVAAGRRRMCVAAQTERTRAAAPAEQTQRDVCSRTNPSGRSSRTNPT
jgi:hypothetical protein